MLLLVRLFSGWYVGRNPTVFLSPDVASVMKRA